MRLVSIQVGLPKTVEYRGQQVTTGIFKEPIQGPVFVGKLNIAGDGQADLRVHGGVDKAVYAYGIDSFSWWKGVRPGDTFAPGSFGENLSVDVLDEGELCIGDTFAIGAAVLQVAQPRFPCYKLGVKFNDPGILKMFARSGRPGVYFRVLQEGAIRNGEELRGLEREPHRFSVRRLFEMVLEKEKDPLEVKRLLQIPELAASMREYFSDT